MKSCKYLFTLFLMWTAVAFAQTDQPIVSDQVIFEEENGVLRIEAEHFYKQTDHAIRAWHRQSANDIVKVWGDADGPHPAGASGNAYIEALPDTRTTHDDEIIRGINFSNTPGKMAVIYYKTYFNNPGRYYVYVRAYSTGSEDNGVHVGLDGTWPESGQRMQWCEGKNAWTWASKQRTAEVHCGVPHLIFLDIKKKGEHEIMFSMREDGFEFDQFLLTKDKMFIPAINNLPAIKLRTGTLPAEPPVVTSNPVTKRDIYNTVLSFGQGVKLMRAQHFPVESTHFYQDQQWLAINPEDHKSAESTHNFSHPDGNYDMVFLGVGENDGQSKYTVSVNGEKISSFTAPLSRHSFEEGVKYVDLWENIPVNKGDRITVHAEVGTDGTEFSRARWGGIAFTPVGRGKDLLTHLRVFSTQQNVAGRGPQEKKMTAPELSFSDVKDRKPDGDGQVVISGELKQWHKVTLNLQGPFAHELDTEPNPFTDYKMTVVFRHESGSPVYKVPGYFAADGDAAESSADNGTLWRAHLSPDKTGMWSYEIHFEKGKMAALTQVPWTTEVAPYHGIRGKFFIGATDKEGRDFRSRGRLAYVGGHYLQFQGDKSYFFKAGADAPETLLAYEDFDATYTLKTDLKTWDKHEKDWNEGDPVWKGGKGKGLIGALNYLSSKGANAFSFLTYNAGGDGYNVWPFVRHDAKFHYDCSKLDQWQIVMDHAQAKGLYLHFKLQETENDDHKRGDISFVPESLDGGDDGPERRLYLRELIARYGYQLALNWNLGEENTQNIADRRDMAAYIEAIDPYDHHRVIHTYPNQQDDVYPSLLGDQSSLTGASLQNHWNHVHHRTLQWLRASDMIGKPWVVANDEQGSASEGVPPDPGYEGYDVNTISYDIHDIRKQTLWANLMAGGAGVEYYFGYKLPENDLVCQDFRSRDRSWDYCKIAIDFFNQSGLPFWEMTNRNDLIGNASDEKEKYCLAKEGQHYLIYLAYTSTTTLDLSDQEGSFSVIWFNPRTGEGNLKGSVESVVGGQQVSIGNPPDDADEDWVVIISR